MTPDPIRPANAGASGQAKARAVLDDARRQMAKARPGAPTPAGDVLIRRLAGALGMSQVDVLTIMRATKISCSHRGLTVGKAENFLREARRFPAHRAKLTAAPQKETSGRVMTPAADAKARARGLRRDRIREAFKAHRANLDDPTIEDSRREKLAGDVMEITGMSRALVSLAMIEAGLVAPRRRTVTAEGCELFIAKLYGSTPAPPERWPAPMPHPDDQWPEAPHQAAAREAAARAATEERTPAAVKPARVPRIPQFPACQRLVDGVGALDVRGGGAVGRGHAVAGGCSHLSDDRRPAGADRGAATRSVRRGPREGRGEHGQRVPADPARGAADRGARACHPVQPGGS